MYKNILIATDGSALAAKAVTEGLELAKKIGASVTFVTVTEIWPAFEMASRVEGGFPNAVEAYERKAKEEADEILTRAVDEAKGMGVDYETVHVADQKAAKGIIATADKKKCDLIMMSSHGRSGITKLLLGSVANEVMTHASTSVHICR